MFDFLLKQPKQQFIHSQMAENLLDKRYQELVVKHHIHKDMGQVKILGHLQQLLNSITEQTQINSNTVFYQLLSKPQNKAKSLYIFGDVGRGKSMLMDVFFDACPVDTKRRVHFHSFMQEVHEYMHQWRKSNEGDPLKPLAKKIKNESVVLCFDELQVTDVADAMILARLFSYLVKLGVIFVATSNHHPDNLYENGLQRDLFIPFIELVKQSSEVVELIAKEDYRLSYFKSIKTAFYLKSGGKGNEFLHQRFKELTNNGNTEARVISVKGREIQFEKVHGDILYSSFNELCNRPLGPADYLEVAYEFKVIFIADIPCLSLDIKDQVRRFVTLIDALYEQKTKLICTLTTPVEELTLKDISFDFKRTRSRLMEMQSERYFLKDNAQ